MNPILRIIDYLFKKNDINGNFDSLNSFFENGISFPRLIEAAFKSGDIPKIIKNPTLKAQKKYNNDLALQFLFNNSQEITKIHPSFQTEKEKLNLLELILKNYFFKINYSEIINKCNLIVSSINLKFESKKDMLNQKCILALLNVLTDGKVQIDDDATKDFDNLMIDSFQKSMVPLVIDQTSFQYQNQYIFFIQIEIILDCFSEKISTLSKKQNDEKNQEIKNEEINETEKEEEEYHDEEKKLDKIQETLLKSLFFKSHIMDEFKEDEFKKNELKEDEFKNDEFKENYKENEQLKKSKELKNNETRKDDNNVYKIKKIDKNPIIDIEIDTDYSDSENENQNGDFVDERKSNEALLKVLNAIGKNDNLYFKSLDQAIDKDNLPKFVKTVLKDEEITKITKLIKPHLEKINDVIKYLSQTRKPNNPIFEVLNFNFKEKKYALSTSILFYTNFLNTFFIKKPRSQMLDRLTTIIFGNLNQDDYFYSIYKKCIKNKINPYENEKVLLDWNSYQALVNFVDIRSTHFKNKNSRGALLFIQNNISQIIKKNSFDEYTSNIPDVAYYQLQFIFDELDKKNFVYRFHENLLRAEKIIKMINVPRYDALTASIKAKYLSLIIQKERYRKFLKSNEAKLDDVPDLDIQKEEEPQKPPTFKERNMQNKDKHIESFKSSLKCKELSKIQSSKSFWNLKDKKVKINNGALIKELPDQNLINKWNENIRSLLTNSSEYVKIIKTDFVKNQKTLKYNEKLYKFFQYNADLKKWERNDVSITNFIKDKKLEMIIPITPLILYINSYENDLMTINSNINNISNPDLDDANIYVYAIYGQLLSNMQFNKSKQNVIPIFLQLHVPDNYKKLISEDDNIRIIIYKIYCFLSFISDINIVVLNKSFYQEQIDLLTTLNYINSNFYQIIKYNSDDNKNKIQVDQLNDFSDDGFSDDENIDENNFNDEILFIDKEDNDKSIDEILSKINIDLKNVHLNNIILINNEAITQDIMVEKYNEFFSSLKNEFNKFYIAESDKLNTKICYINVNNPITYRGLSTYIEELTNDFAYTYKKSFAKMNYYSITEMKMTYINLRASIKWESNLETLFNERFMQLTQINKSSHNVFFILSQIDKELSNLIFHFDEDFLKKCNSIIVKMGNNLNQKNKDYIKSELINSSNNYLEYLKKIINMKSFLFDNAQDIIYSYANFMQNEYTEIIHELGDKNDQISIFSFNHEILDSVIENGTKNVKEIITDFKKKIKLQTIPNTSKSTDDINAGTNYAIRETESVREIEVLVQAGHLKDVIEQDF